MPRLGVCRIAACALQPPFGLMRLKWVEFELEWFELEWFELEWFELEWFELE